MEIWTHVIMLSFTGMLSSSLCRLWLDYVLLFIHIIQTLFVIFNMVHVSVPNHTVHLYF